MEVEEAITLLKEKGYKIKPPAAPKKIPTGCYRIDCRGGVGPFFMEGIKGEEWQTKQHYEKLGYEVMEVTFAEDKFYLLELPNNSQHDN